MTDAPQQQKRRRRRKSTPAASTAKPVRLHIVRPGAAETADAAEALPATCTLWDAAVHADWCTERTPAEDAHLAATLAHVRPATALPEPLQRRLHAGRRLGTHDSDPELLALARLMACSSVDAPLARGELVVVPHPRGGLVCAAVDGVVVAPRCCVDPAVAHRAVRVRVVCPGATSAAALLHTDLQPFLVGRFLQRPSDASSTVEETAAATTATAATTAREDDEEEEGDGEKQRPVGHALSAGDYAVVRFSAAAVLAVGQTVAVPRSSGGLTYGVVREARTSFCTIDVAAPHRTAVWRVDIGPSGAFKDLPAAVVGFFPSCDQRPSPVPPVLALQNQPDHEATTTAATVPAVSSTAAKEDDEKLVIVVDGRDVGCSFAFDRRLVSTSGIETTVKYYEARGCSVRVLVPACCLTPDEEPSQSHPQEEEGHTQPLWVDDSTYLRSLDVRGALTTTPACDGAPYLEALDRLCRTARAYAVTNAPCPRGSATAWLADHTLRYTTDGFAFIPVLTALPPPLH